MKILILILITSFISLTASANIENPARKYEDVATESWGGTAIKVSSARIMLADYDLIKKDFPALKNFNHDQIDQWLISGTGYIAETQLDHSAVNTRIPVEPIRVEAFRPPHYNRALVFQVEGGLIDGKGFGSRMAYQGDHSNGLATLGEVLREFIYEKMVQKIFNFSKIKDHTDERTVGSYAVIDWGFRVKHADGSTSAAGAILRQAHRRSTGKSSLLDEKKATKIEKILRRYGVTSAGAYRHFATHDINIQGTSEGAVIDFGAYLTIQKITKDSKLFYGDKVLISRIKGSYAQPNPDLRVPFQIWGTTLSGKEDPKADNPWIWSHEMAEAFASGQAQRSDVENHLRNMLDPVDLKLPIKTTNQCSGIFN